MTPDLIDGEGWKEPTPLDLKGFHDRAVAWAVKRFHGKGEEILAGYFILVSVMGDVAIMHLGWDNEEQKYAVARSMRKMLQRPDFAAHAFITEAWAVRASKEGFDLDTPPRLQPERQDVLQICSVLRDGSNRMSHIAVRYYKNNRKPPRLLERDDHFSDQPDNIVGTMFNFFIPHEENELRIKASIDEARARKDAS